MTIQMERVQSPMFDGAQRRGYNIFCTVMNTAVAASLLATPKLCEGGRATYPSLTG